MLQKFVILIPVSKFLRLRGPLGYSLLCVVLLAALNGLANYHHSWPIGQATPKHAELSALHSEEASELAQLKSDAHWKAQAANAQKVAAQERAKAQADAIQSGITLGLTPEAIKDSFNQQSDLLQTNLQIRSFGIENDSVENGFEYMFSGNLGIMGSVNKDGSIRDVVLLAKPDKQLQPDAIQTCMAELIAATRLNLSPDAAWQILSAMGISSAADINQWMGSTVQNGLKYSVLSSSENGVMFTITNANDVLK